MPRAKKFPANRGLNSEFFAKLARQGFLREFSGLDFSARKFPLQRVRIVAAPLAHQNLGVAENQRRNDGKFGFP
jgi:hypothetical protein